MIVGFEWIIDAAGCDARILRDETRLREVFARIVADLGLKTIGDGHWHEFPGAGGVTGLLMLTESHLACHTYPEFGTATFNLYCCRERPRWNWEANLAQMLGARSVEVKTVERGAAQLSDSEIEILNDNPESRIQNPKSKIAGGAK